MVSTYSMVSDSDYSNLGLGLKVKTQKIQVSDLVSKLRLKILVLDLVSKLRLRKFQSRIRSQKRNSDSSSLGLGLPIFLRRFFYASPKVNCVCVVDNNYVSLLSTCVVINSCGKLCTVLCFREKILHSGTPNTFNTLREGFKN